MAAGGKKSGGAPEMENIKLKDMLSSAKANFLNSTADQEKRINISGPS